MERLGTTPAILLGFTLTAMLGGLVISWNAGQVDMIIDPRIERICHDEVKARSPLGYRAIITHGYQEPEARLGIARGGHEAQYMPNKWTNIIWTCRIDPKSRQVLRFEVQATRGGQRLKAAATGF